MHTHPPAASTVTAPPPRSPTLLPAAMPPQKGCSHPRPRHCPLSCPCPPRCPARTGFCRGCSVAAVGVQVALLTLSCSRDWLQGAQRGGSSSTPSPSARRALRASTHPALSATLHLSCPPPTTTTTTAVDSAMACSYARTTTRDPRQPSSPTYSGWLACHPSVVSPRLTTPSPPACPSVWMDWGGPRAPRRTET